MSPNQELECRQHFLAETLAGALPEMAAVFAGISDVRTVLRWAKTDPDFDAAWGRARAEATQRERLADRAKCPTAIVDWVRARGGKANATTRGIGADLGCSNTKVHNEIRRLVAARILRATFGSRGTFLELLDPTS
jgi:hypothetical protein